MIKAILIFYKKIFLPILISSIAVGVFFGGIVPESSISSSIGQSYMILAPIFHYYKYDLKNNNEYYFYYNLGLSKKTLWLSSSTMSVLIGLIFIVL